MTIKPIILTVDDEPLVARAVQRDLLRRYGERYRVLRAESGAEALSTLGELRRREVEDARKEPVALLVADQKMPGMSGVEFLEKSREIVPDAMRVLLTAYADTESAIRAINQAEISQYLRKPWEPPEESLYPPIDAVLAKWLEAYDPPYDGISVIGHRWSPASHDLRAFLERNLVPFRWVDIERDEEGRKVLSAMEHAGEQVTIPIVELADGKRVSNPTPEDLAEKIGLRTRAVGKTYDLVVVGAGPAGLAAAVYGASEGLNTLLIEKIAPGGQAGTSSRIENYLGFPDGLTGRELTDRAVRQAQRFGAEILTPRRVAEMRVEGPYKILKLEGAEEVSTRALLIATGVMYRKLGPKSVDDFTGKGVYYGATPLDIKGCSIEDHIYVVGGGNSAGQAAVAFSAVARSVTIVVRGSGLAQTMSQYLVDRLKNVPNVSVWTKTEVAEVEGSDHLERITFKCDDGRQTTVDGTAHYIFIGAEPKTDWLSGLVQRDKYDFVLTGRDIVRDREPLWPLEREPYILETSQPGVFAAGDVRHESVKRVASAVGEGSIAVQLTHRYLAEG